MLKRVIGSLLLLAVAGSALADDALAKPNLAKASCSVTCDDGTSCSIDDGKPKKPAQEEKNLLTTNSSDSTEAWLDVIARRDELAKVDPKFSAYVNELEAALLRSDRATAERVAREFSNYATRIGKPITVPKVTCSCGGIAGSMASCQF